MEMALTITVTQAPWHQSGTHDFHAPEKEVVSIPLVAGAVVVAQSCI